MDPVRRRRKQRHRVELMSVFALITLLALGAIAMLVMRMAKLPGTASLSAATSGAPQAEVADVSDGLSYRLLSAPWRDGCPMRDTPVRWTSGEGAVAGHVVSDGHRVTWWANACSGVLPAGLQQADLARTAQAAAAAIDTDRALRHHRTTVSSGATRVYGHRAWVIRYEVRFPGAQLAWSSEAAAVVVVERGHGQAPAVFYVSVPDNLGSTTLTTLISSLR
jgi:hypothetical protein